MIFRKKDKENVEGYAKYSGIAFQMLASIGLFVWLGTYLDKKMQTSQPYWTIGLTLMAVVASMVSIIKNFLPKK